MTSLLLKTKKVHSWLSANIKWKEALKQKWLEHWVPSKYTHRPAQAGCNAVGKVVTRQAEDGQF